MFYNKTDVLKNAAKFKEKHRRWGLFSKKFQAFKPAT